MCLLWAGCLLRVASTRSMNAVTLSAVLKVGERPLRKCVTKLGSLTASRPKSLARIPVATRKASTRARNCSLYVRMMDIGLGLDF